MNSITGDRNASQVVWRMSPTDAYDLADHLELEYPDDDLARIDAPLLRSAADDALGRGGRRAQ